MGLQEQNLPGKIASPRNADDSAKHTSEKENAVRFTQRPLQTHQPPPLPPPAQVKSDLRCYWHFLSVQMTQMNQKHFKCGACPGFLQLRAGDVCTIWCFCCLALVNGSAAFLLCAKVKGLYMPMPADHVGAPVTIRLNLSSS